MLKNGHGFAVAVGLLVACAPEDREAPSTTDLAIGKAPAESGDEQVGVAGEPLERDLRARVTRDGEPVEGVTVYWTTFQGSMHPPSDLTDADGLTASRWTTEDEYLEQEAFASLDPVPGPRAPGSVLPGMIMFTALAYPDPDAPNTVHVLSAGGNRFEPASITVTEGGTVNWLWPAGSAGHNGKRNGHSLGCGAASTMPAGFSSCHFATASAPPSTMNGTIYSNDKSVDRFFVMRCNERSLPAPCEVRSRVGEHLP